MVKNKKNGTSPLPRQRRLFRVTQRGENWRGFFLWNQQTLIRFNL